MKNIPHIDRGILIPLGVGILSIAGIGLLLLIVRFDTPEAASSGEPTNTLFKYLFLATETYTPDPTAQTASKKGIETETISFPNETTTAASESANEQSGTPTITTSIAPNATSAPTVDINVFLVGKYDDIDDRIIYEGDWVNEIVEIAYNETLFISTKIGNKAGFRFTGQQFQIGYLEDPELGTAIVLIDNDEYSLDQSSNSGWLSPELPYGEHFVLITHESGEIIILDYITILASP